VWSRPVPVIGDVSSAAERAASPDGWALSPEERDVFYAVVAARRDIRRFRPDPLSDEVLERVLTAGHMAPSVGHSQPWRFVVVRDPATRERAAVMADCQRLGQASQLTPDSARRLLDLQLEGIREAPVGVVVACDRRTPASGVLGRATYPDADLWSCACAIENMWLAARAEGLGMGWVTLFRPDDLALLLGFPAGVSTLGWLCLGWPDERLPDPGLERAGWSRRTELADVVLQERWPDDSFAPSERPAPPPSHLRAPGPASVVTARDEADTLLTPPGSLGVLDRATDRVIALGHRTIETGQLILVGTSHPVAAHGVSPYESRVTADVLAAAIAGEALGVVAASSAGMTAMIVDAGVHGGVGDLVAGAADARPREKRGDLVGADALTTADVEYLVEVGRGLGRAGGRSGLVALGEVGVGNTTVAAALTSVLCQVDPEQVVGQGAGADSAMVERKMEVVRSATARAQGRHGDTLGQALVALGALGGAEIAVLVGVICGAAEAGAAVVLDGLATGAAALLAVSLEPAIAAHLIAGHRSRETAHELVLQRLGLEPLLDLRIRAGEGAGACLATGMLKAALSVRRATARTGPPSR